MQYPSGKILNIQALRGLAVILVIALHLTSNEEKFAHGYTVLPDFLAIGSSGVDVFFVISGFVMVTITRGSFQEKGAISKFIYHRLTRIYPLYWFYSLLMLAVFWLQRETGHNTRMVDITASFLLLPQPQLPLLVVGWTLVHEIYFYLVFAVLLAFPQRWLLPLMLLWGAASIIGWLLFSPVKSPLVQLITNPLTLEFIAGGMIAWCHYSGKSASRNGRLFLILAIAWWLSGYGICVKMGLTPESSGWLRVLLYGCPAAMAVFAFVAIEKSSGWQLPGWLIWIGDASFSIYLSHLLVIASIGRIWEKFGAVGPWTNSLVLAVMVVSVLAMGMASFRLIERPLLNLSRRFEFAYRVKV